MKTSILQLIIVGLLLNAGYQAARSYYLFYDFKTELVELVHHGRAGTTSEMHQRVVELGSQYDLDLKWEDVDVSVASGVTTVTVDYVDEIEFVPRVYKRPWTYHESVDAERPRPLVVDDRR